MIAFAAYAVAVWYYAAQGRRRWQGLASVVLGLAGLLLVAYFHYCLNDWTHGRIYLRVLQSLLYPYAALVTGVGLYIACLPRRCPDHACVKCQYDLRGLVGEAEVCPECGGVIMDPGVSRAGPARSSPPAAPLRAGPRWPAIGAPAACHHSAGE
jgi:hypothetical protein